MKRTHPPFGLLLSVAVALLITSPQASADAVGEGWDHFGAGRWKEGLAATEKGLAALESEATKQAAAAKIFAGEGHERDAGAMNAAGTLLLIRGRIFEQMGREADAIAAYGQCVESYPWAQAWDPAGWFWHPAADARKRWWMARLRQAVTTRELPAGFFGADENAFDVPAQRTAVNDLAAEWLQQENFDALEFLGHTALKEKLRFTNGQWVLHWMHMGLDSPPPGTSAGDWAAHHARWLEKKPDSITARMAEVKRQCSIAFTRRKLDTSSVEAWRAGVERYIADVASAREMLEKTPADSPEWFAVQQEMQMVDPEPAENDSMDEGWQKFPGYDTMLERRIWLFAACDSEPNSAWEKQAARFARKHGQMHYASAVRYASIYRGLEAYKAADRRQLKLSWEAQIEEHPGSLHLRHLYAKTLAALRDPDAAKWLESLRGTYQVDVWKSPADLTRARAGAAKPARID